MVCRFCGSSEIDCQSFPKEMKELYEWGIDAMPSFAISRPRETLGGLEVIGRALNMIPPRALPDIAPPKFLEKAKEDFGRPFPFHDLIRTTGRDSFLQINGKPYTTDRLRFIITALSRMDLSTEEINALTKKDVIHYLKLVRDQEKFKKVTLTEQAIEEISRVVRNQGPGSPSKKQKELRDKVFEKLEINGLQPQKVS